jgi:hypothetical protein
MNTEQILESLSKLDPANKDHWTQNGQPLLSAVGEGVTRSQILEVAPLFSRESPVLPTAEELPSEPTYQDEIVDYHAKLAEANVKLEAALKAQAEAIAEVKHCHDELEAIRDAQRNSDKRTDTQINQDLIYADLNRRMAKAQDHAKIRQFMDVHGVPSTDVNLLTMGPADRAIARRNIEARKSRR